MKPEKITWSDDLAEIFSESLSDNLYQVIKNIKSGTDEVLYWPECGYTITRLELPENLPTVLVIVAAAGKDSKKVFPYLVKLARENGAEVLQTAVNDPAVYRLHTANGWKPREIILQYEL